MVIARGLARRPAYSPICPLTAHDTRATYRRRIGWEWRESKNIEVEARMGGTKPFIVQCEKCNKVLSDTTALVLSDKERNILVVKGASNIIVSKAGRVGPGGPPLATLFFSPHPFRSFTFRARDGWCFFFTVSLCVVLGFWAPPD